MSFGEDNIMRDLEDVSECKMEWEEVTVDVAAVGVVD